MRLLPILFSILLITLISGGCRKAHRHSGPADYEEGLTRQAWMMLDTGAAFDECLAVQQQAVRQLRRGESRENPVAVLEQMAYFLFSAGRLEEAHPYFIEALDSLHAQAGPPASECAIQLYGDISQFYERLGMIEKAIEYSDSALEVSRRTGGMLMCDIWRFRMNIYANAGLPAQAFACIDSAYTAIRHGMDDADTTLLLAITDAERANIILARDPAPSPDSVDLAVALLRNIRAIDNGRDYTEYAGAYGYALYLQGHKSEGIRTMEEAVDRIRDLGDLELTFLELRRLIEVYNAEKMFDRVSRVYNEYTALSDSMSHARHNLDLVIAHVRADVAAKEKENLALQDNLRKKHRQNIAITVLFIVFAAVAAYLLFVGAAYYRKMKRRRDTERARRLSAEAGFREALNERDSALERIEAIKSEISDCTATDILRRPQALSHNTGLFRRAFNAMYPRFADDLQRDYPTLTDTDAVFCMLIYLGHSTEEISVYLNISRASVNSARYRIRSKLRLAKQENLDKFLQSRPG